MEKEKYKRYGPCLLVEMYEELINASENMFCLHPIRRGLHREGLSSLGENSLKGEIFNILILLFFTYEPSLEGCERHGLVGKGRIFQL